MLVFFRLVSILPMPCLHWHIERIHASTTPLTLMRNLCLTGFNGIFFLRVNSPHINKRPRACSVGAPSSPPCWAKSRGPAPPQRPQEGTAGWCGPLPGQPRGGGGPPSSCHAAAPAQRHSRILFGWPAGTDGDEAPGRPVSRRRRRPGTAGRGGGAASAPTPPHSRPWCWPAGRTVPGGGGGRRERLGVLGALL